ncbi:MAG: glycosyltransferase family 1 protein, partial [Candidatus Gracilibacteria bacterium]
FNAPIFYFRPSFVMIHDLIVSFFPGRKNKSILKKFAYNLVLKTVTKKAKKIIAVSEHTKKDLIKILKIKAEKISVIYEGIGEEFQRVKSAEILELTKQKYGIDKPFILYTGVYRYHKNITGLLKAFKILKDKFHAPHKLVITGREDPYYPDVRRTAHELGLKDDVIFAGLVPEEDLIALYSCADLHTLPSFYEGFGFTPLEAMACGTPTAVSHTSSLPEICGKAALFFDPHDTKEMASTLHKAIADEDLRKRLIKAGHERVQMFKWENLAKQTLEVYNNLLSENHAPPKSGKLYLVNFCKYGFRSDSKLLSRCRTKSWIFQNIHINPNLPWLSKNSSENGFNTGINFKYFRKIIFRKNVDRCRLLPSLGAGSYNAKRGNNPPNECGLWRGSYQKT